jgi:hypothetical protein
MTPAQFRRIALSFPGAEERAHHNHPDFRAGGKVFATLGYPDAAWGMINLMPDQQALLVETSGDIFRPVPGGWGLRGATNVRLAAANAAVLKHAMTMAFETVTTKAKAKAGRSRPAPAKRQAKKKA